MPDSRLSSASVAISAMKDKELIETGNKMGLGLSLDELKMLKGYFASLGREPTDIEMHAMAQAWSEHCCYKSSKFYLKQYLSGLQRDYVVLAMEDDAGVIDFDEDNVYVLKMESHNHPSAVEPYGGAATGVGGIIRDVLCMGAKPVALLDSLFFGDFRAKSHPGLSERFIFNRVVAGIRDYGNRMGIPTVAGSIEFDSSYSNNPLVNAGCIGIARRDQIVRSRISKVGDLLLLAGGKTGRDGIHGVNFASRALDDDRESNIGSVQLGNPVIEEALSHAVLDATEQGLLDGMKDLGGGGLSSSLGELCFSGGTGAQVDLENVPLKEEGMRPWEIWVSESQERMLMAISRENLPKVKEIFDAWDLDNAVIGEVTEGQQLVVRFLKETILDLDLSFMTSGPVYCRSYDSEIPSENKWIQPIEPKDFGTFIKERVSSLSNCSREPVVRTYDFTVKGCTVTGPMTGTPGLETHSDAAVIKPVENSFKGLVLTSGSRPYMIAGNPYLGTLNLLSECVRNILASGGYPHSLADALNFGNPENAAIMAEFVSALRAIKDFCVKLELPVVSGNVSFYNQGHTDNIKPTPVIFMTGLIDDVRRRLQSFFRKEGNPVYVIGSFNPDLSGSSLLSDLGYGKTGSPVLDLDELKSMLRPFLSAVQLNLIVAAHDVSTGGLVNTLAEMSFGKGIGGEFDLSPIEAARTMNKLFAEGGNRIIVEVPQDREEEFKKALSSAQCRKIGVTGGHKLVIYDNELLICGLEVNELRRQWSSAMNPYL